MSQYRPKAVNYHCKICNVWMSNNRGIISMHENGAKHKEKLAEKMKEKREARKAEDKSRRDVNAAIRDIEAAASEAMGMGGANGGFFDPSSGASCKVVNKMPGVDWNAVREEEKGSWEKRKKDREQKNKDERKAKNNEDEVMRYKREGASGGADGGKGGSGEAEQPQEDTSPGFYTVDGVTYLEGTKFHSLFVPDDVEVQAFVGGEDGEWVDGLITGKEEKELEGTDGLIHRSYSFCYLPEDAEKEVEVEGLSGADVRIKLGAEGAPKTMDEAMLLLGGGERVTTFENAGEDAVKDEDTGLGGWGVVEERTVTNEVWEREERARKERVERERRVEEEMRAKDRERAEMEMKKFDGGDSALQSYNVFGGTGYKGIDIGKGEGTVGEKRVVAEGKKVGFKKRRKK